MDTDTRESMAVTAVKMRERFGELEGASKVLVVLAITEGEVDEVDLRYILEQAEYSEDCLEHVAEVLYWFDKEGVLTLLNRLPYPSLADGSDYLYLQSLDNESMQEFMVKLKSDGQLIRNGL